MADNYTAGQVGTILGQYFINNKEKFIEVYEEYFKSQDEEKIRQSARSLQRAIKVLTVYNNAPKIEGNELSSAAEVFYEKYKAFEQLALGRPGGADIQIGFRDNNGHYDQLSNISAESYGKFQEQWGKRRENFGIQTQSLYSDSRRKGTALEIQSFILNHLNDMLSMLQNDIPNDAQYSDLCKRYSDNLVRFKNNRHEMLASNPWGYYLLSDVSDPSGKYIMTPQQSGQAYEAYFDHLANMHQWVYTFLATRGAVQPEYLNKIIEGELNTSVYIEEGGSLTYTGNFPRLLFNAKGNTTPWFASGDIVIVNPETGHVVYNIQLKTSRFHANSGFAQSITKLNSFIEHFLAANTPTEMAELIWKDFQTSLTGTSSTTEALGLAVVDQSEEIVQQTLKAFGVKTT